MLFSSLEFMLFLPVVWVLYRLTPKAWHRALLLVASYAFYMSWGPIYGLLLAGVSVVNWAAGRLIAAEWRPKAVLATAVIANLGVLAFFKYIHFFIENLVFAADVVGVDASALQGRWHVILPLGISFFTFQGISYTIDVYRDRSQVVPSLFDLLLFNAWFPQLVAGPIVRASELVYQFDNLEAPRWARFQSGAALAMRGFFKKAVVADHLAVVVDHAFHVPDQWGTVGAWVYMGAYAMQIYFDFSGYSDIAIGISRCFGIELPLNFDNPYASGSITEFWRRWHISLSSWLRDYLYIPLGGNRNGHQYRNLFLTMLLGGLWHGASWNFVVWGAFHGVLLAAHKLYRVHTPKRVLGRLDASLAWRAFAVTSTFVLVVISWVPFRAQSFAETGVILRAMFAFEGFEIPTDALGSTALVVLITYGVYRVLRWATEATARGRRLVAWGIANPALSAAVLTQIAVLTFALSPSGASPFIYFQF